MRAGIHTLMNIWRVFVLVVGALLLPLAAAGDGPANKVGISRGYGTLHCADRGEGGVLASETVPVPVHLVTWPQ